MGRIKLPPRLFDEEKTTASGLTSPFLVYSQLGAPPPNPRDGAWLEETEKGAVPGAYRDEDGDGYREISALRLQLKEAGEPFLNTYRLAQYFDDRKLDPNSGLVAAHFLKDHGEDELTEMKALADARDFPGIKKHFRALAEAQGGSLEKLRSYLHLYLSLIAVHSGYGIPDALTLEDNPYGFSVAADGRLRVDCVTFTQLAHAALQGIAGLSFSYISMAGLEANSSHVVLLASDGCGGNLLVDNGSVLSFTSDDVDKYLAERFSARGYTLVSDAGGAWPPGGKRRVLYQKS